MFKNKRLIIIFCIICVIALAASILSYLIFFKQDKLIVAIDNGDIDAAQIYYEKHIENNPQKLKKYKENISQLVEDIYNDFASEEIGFDVAEKKMKVICALGIVPTSQEFYEKLLFLNTSREAFKAGNKYFDEENYKEALIEYQKLSNCDEYQQQKINTTKSKYKEDSFLKLDNYLTNEDYESISTLYSEIRELLVEDTSIADMFAEKTTTYIRNCINDGKINIASNALNELRTFMNDETFYSLQGIISEKQYTANKNDAMNFLKGKWQRVNNDSDLNGMVVQVKDTNATTASIISCPSTALQFYVGDTKWSNIYVIDRETVHIMDMTKNSYSRKGTFYSATMKLNYNNKTISVTYDVVDGSTNGQIQSWKKIN